MHEPPIRCSATTAVWCSQGVCGTPVIASDVFVEAQGIRNSWCIPSPTALLPDCSSKEWDAKGRFGRLCLLASRPIEAGRLASLSLSSICNYYCARRHCLVYRQEVFLSALVNLPSPPKALNRHGSIDPRPSTCRRLYSKISGGADRTISTATRTRPNDLASPVPSIQPRLHESRRSTMS